MQRSKTLIFLTMMTKLAHGPITAIHFWRLTNYIITSVT